MSNKEKGDNVVEFRRKPHQGNKENKTSGQRQLPPFGYFAGLSILRGSRPGQIIACKILSVQPKGYTVVTLPDGLPGFLASNVMRRADDLLLCTFVCVDKNRLILSERFALKTSNLVREAEQPVSDEETTDD